MVSDVLDHLAAGFVGPASWTPPRGLRTEPIFGRIRILIAADQYLGIPPVETQEWTDWWCSLKPGEIVWVKGSMDWAFWGELCTVTAIKVGLAATVVDGLTRDTRRVAALKYPVFSRGYSGRDIDGRGYVVALDADAPTDGGIVRTGDWAFLDWDGVAVIYADRAEKVVEEVRVRADAEEALSVRIQDAADLGEVLREARL